MLGRMQSGGISGNFGGAGADLRPLGALRMKIVSQCREQARWVYNSSRFLCQKRKFRFRTPDDEATTTSRFRLLPVVSFVFWWHPLASTLELALKNNEHTHIFLRSAPKRFADLRGVESAPASIRAERPLRFSLVGHCHPGRWFRQMEGRCPAKRHPVVLKHVCQHPARSVALHGGIAIDLCEMNREDEVPQR